MRVIDKREEDKREEWHVGDIIRFGNYTVNENYGIKEFEYLYCQYSSYM